MYYRKWSIAIPSSFTSNLTSLIQRTNAVAMVARAAAIFRIRNIYIYRDPLIQDPEALRQVVKLLRYMNTPPYLRKDVFPLDKDLSYVGILPPLRTPMHMNWEDVKALELPQIRLGLVKGKYFGKYVIDVGLKKYVVVREKCTLNKMIPVMLEKVKGKYIWGRIIDEEDVDGINVYLGYKVVRIKRKIPDFIRMWNGLKIATSRKGVFIGDAYKKLRNNIDKSDDVLIIFGSFEYGLDRIFDYYNEKIDDLFDYNINIVANQGVVTIRVEEAVLISLSLLRFIEGF